jgi:hypothetical protein
MKVFKKSGASKKKWQVLVPLVAAFLLVLITSLFFVYTPLRKLQQLNAIGLTDSLFMQSEGRIYSQQSLKGLSRELAMKKALLELAGSDSIALSVHLSDSLVCLSIKGVDVHKSHISSYQNDGVLRLLDNATYMKIFSKPLKIVSQKASIAKEPVVIRKAPKTPEEAALLQFQPDTTEPGRIFIFLELEYGLRVELEPENAGFKNRGFLYYIVEAIDKYRNLLAGVVNEYHPVIRVRLTDEDLIAIYRALPKEANIAIAF